MSSPSGTNSSEWEKLLRTRSRTANVRRKSQSPSERRERGVGSGIQGISGLGENRGVNATRGPIKFLEIGNTWHHDCFIWPHLRFRPRSNSTKQTTEIINNPMLQKLNKNRGGFTLVEIMTVVAIIALLAAIAVPNFLRARKRSQATRILEDLRIIDSACDQYAIENNKSGGATVSWTDIQVYLKKGSVLYNSTGMDLFGNLYVGFSVDTIPK